MNPIDQVEWGEFGQTGCLAIARVVPWWCNGPSNQSIVNRTHQSLWYPPPPLFCAKPKTQQGPNADCSMLTEYIQKNMALYEVRFCFCFSGDICGCMRVVKITTPAFKFI
jgi:hypothetical protein